MWGSDSNDNDEQEAPVQKTGAELLEPVKVLNKIDQRFDSLYSDIIGNLNNYNLYSSKLQTVAVQDIANSLGAKTKEIETETKKEKQDKELHKMLNAGSNDILGNMNELSIPSERKQRYEFYEEIPNVNYIAHRMLKVYLDNILIKNVQTKQILNISENSANSFFLETIKDDIGKHYENFMKTSIIFFDLQNKLKNQIVPSMLKFGNFFVETVNLKSVVKLSEDKQLIMEATDNVSDVSSHLVTEVITDGYIKGSSIKGHRYCLFEYETVQESQSLNIKADPTTQMKDLLKGSSTLLQEDYAGYWNDITDDNHDDDFKFNDVSELDFGELKNIYLKHISPNKVIIIEQDGFLYGYLVVDDIKGKQETEVDILKRFTTQEDSYNNKSERDIKHNVIENMTKGIIRKLNRLLTSQHFGGRNVNNFEDLNLGDSVSDSIKVILYHKLEKQAKLKFRFVSPNRMINFSTNVDKFGPYGTSIFDPIIQPVKMYTLALMSSIVSRLSRASVVRKWTIEAGNKKNHAEIIEKVKKDISNKSISFDSLSNIKNIAQNVTDFRDIATIQVNGQRFIDMEVMPMGDRSLPLNDLQDLRTELIASTGIPSVYLNIGDQVDLRESLVSLNTSFATTISAFQSNIDDSCNQLFSSIFSILLENNGYENSEFVLSQYYKTSLNPPLILTVQSNEALISSVSNIIGMLKSAELIVDPEALLKLYIPQMNWEDLLKSGKSFIKKQAKEQLMQPQDDQQ